MRILLVKTSSLGDVVHNLPVVSDLRRAFPDARIDWCIEEALADIAHLHPEVCELIPVAIRRWRRSLTRWETWREMADFRKRIRQTSYDAILDTQGLVKSALIVRLARGRHLGYSAEVAREAFAARFYDETFLIPPNAHAVTRNRWLAAAAFDYPVDLPLNYGITAPDCTFSWLPDTPVSVLLTATSRDDKLWSEANWVVLAQSLVHRGLTPVLPSGSPSERQRAERIATQVPGSLVAPPLRLTELAALLGRSRLAVGVDTGLVHLAAALGIPTLALYVATEPALTGVLGTGFFRNFGGRGKPPHAAEVMVAIDQVLR